MVRIRLTKTLAAVLNGLDISALRIGDVIELPDSAARMMILEGWAELDLVASTPSATPLARLPTPPSR